MLSTGDPQQLSTAVVHAVVHKFARTHLTLTVPVPDSERRWRRALPVLPTPGLQGD
ncbi:MAG: hypothetical protein ACR2M5_01010 [Nakamurella sp.]